MTLSGSGACLQQVHISNPQYIISGLSPQHHVYVMHRWHVQETLMHPNPTKLCSQPSQLPRSQTEMTAKPGTVKYFEITWLRILFQTIKNYIFMYFTVLRDKFVS
jgi:hypothetical protein